MAYTGNIPVFNMDFSSHVSVFLMYSIVHRYNINDIYPDIGPNIMKNDTTFKRISNLDFSFEEWFSL